jgi:hypothetical protein
LTSPVNAAQNSRTSNAGHSIILLAAGRAPQRGLLLRCGTFLILRAAEAPAEVLDLDRSLGFPEDYASEVERDETCSFFTAPVGTVEKVRAEWAVLRKTPAKLRVHRGRKDIIETGIVIVFELRTIFFDGQALDASDTECSSLPRAGSIRCRPCPTREDCGRSWWFPSLCALEPREAARHIGSQGILRIKNEVIAVFQRCGLRSINITQTSGIAKSTDLNPAVRGPLATNARAGFRTSDGF